MKTKTQKRWIKFSGFALIFLINMPLVRQKCCEGTNVYLCTRNFCIQSQCRKIRTRKNSVFGHISYSAIMTRTRLRNKFLKNWTQINRGLYTQQRNQCELISRKTEKEFYGNINEKDVLNSKTFWKTVKPFFSDKAMTQYKITLTEKNFHFQLMKKK